MLGTGDPMPLFLWPLILPIRNMTICVAIAFAQSLSRVWLGRGVRAALTQRSDLCLSHLLHWQANYLPLVLQSLLNLPGLLYGENPASIFSHHILFIFFTSFCLSEPNWLHVTSTELWFGFTTEFPCSI